MSNIKSLVSEIIGPNMVGQITDLGIDWNATDCLIKVIELTEKRTVTKDIKLVIEYLALSITQVLDAVTPERVGQVDSPELAVKAASEIPENSILNGSQDETVSIIPLNVTMRASYPWTMQGSIACVDTNAVFKRLIELGAHGFIVVERFDKPNYSAIRDTRKLYLGELRRIGSDLDIKMHDYILTSVSDEFPHSLG